VGDLNVGASRPTADIRECQPQPRRRMLQRQSCRIISTETVRWISHVFLFPLTWVKAGPVIGWHFLLINHRQRGETTTIN
jgi:hypothetical protein